MSEDIVERLDELAQLLGGSGDWKGILVASAIAEIRELRDASDQPSLGEIIIAARPELAPKRADGPEQPPVSRPFSERHSDLDLCPFCFAPAILDRTPFPNIMWRVRCGGNDCKVLPHTAHCFDADAAIADWNYRAVKPVHHPYPYVAPSQPEQCSVCAIKFTGPMGYVCPHPDCPTSVRTT